MKLAIMQPYFFPYIGYFQMINAVDKFVFYDDVQFIQRGWINRNYIISKDGKQLFTIPLKKHSLTATIDEVEILSNVKWKESFLKTIFLTYKKAPYFDIAYKIVKKSIELDSNYINNYCVSSIKNVFEYLDINKEFKVSTELKYSKNVSKTEKIIEIINLENATELILPPGSRELYRKNDFSIPVYFLLPNEKISYKQFNNSFVSNLSIIDLLMFVNKNEIKDFFLNQYTLI